MAFLQNSLLHPLSELFSWLFGQGGRGASLTSSAPALQPQRAFCDGSPRLSLAFDTPGHAAVAAYRGRPQGADQVTFPLRSQLLQQQEQQRVSRRTHTHIFPLWISTTFAVTLSTCLHTHSSFPRIHIVHFPSLINSVNTESIKYKVHSILNSCLNSSFNSRLKAPSVLIYEFNYSPFLKLCVKIAAKAIPSCAHLLSPVIL